MFGGWALLGSVYVFYVADPLGNYAAWAWLAGLVPVAVIAGGDYLSIKAYEEGWRRIFHEYLGPVLLDMETLAGLRRELRSHILLRFFAPPPIRNVRAQMFHAAVWWPAIVAREGAGYAERFGDWITDVWAFALGLSAAGLFLASIGNQYPMAFGLGCMGLSLARMGYSLLRMAGRYQAILDYFAAWRTESRQQQEES